MVVAMDMAMDVVVDVVDVAIVVVVVVAVVVVEDVEMVAVVKVEIVAVFVVETDVEPDLFPATIDPNPDPAASAPEPEAEPALESFTELFPCFALLTYTPVRAAPTPITIKSSATNHHFKCLFSPAGLLGGECGCSSIKVATGDS